MNEQEVKEYVGIDAWGDFLDFISGQTVGVCDSGNIIYYDWDVERFKRNYDRRKEDGL